MYDNFSVYGLTWKEYVTLLVVTNPCVQHDVSFNTGSNLVHHHRK